MSGGVRLLGPCWWETRYLSRYKAVPGQDASTTAGGVGWSKWVPIVACLPPKWATESTKNDDEEAVPSFNRVNIWYYI